MVIIPWPKQDIKLNCSKVKQSFSSYVYCCGTCKSLVKYPFLFLPPCSNDVCSVFSDSSESLFLTLPCFLSAHSLDGCSVFPSGSSLSPFPHPRLNVSMHCCQINLLRLHLLMYPLPQDPVIILMAHFKQLKLPKMALQYLP